MNTCLHAQTSDGTMLEQLQLERVNAYEITGVTDISDITRIQAYCDALHLDATWRISRHLRPVWLHVTRPTPQLDLDGTAA
jgi:hypothetical protein